MEFDARFKLLLTSFFHEFIELFLPEFSQQIDWRQRPEFLDKELQDLLPDRPKGTVDLLVKVRSLRPARGAPDDRLCLMHVEIEGRKSRRAMGGRMWRYFFRLTETFGLPTVPVVIYLKVGGEGVGWQSYDIRVWNHCFNHFEFPYISVCRNWMGECTSNG